jgi:repressor of nif and glnA expression
MKPSYAAYTSFELESVTMPLFQARQQAVRLGMTSVVKAIDEVYGALTAKLREVQSNAREAQHRAT